MANMPVHMVDNIYNSEIGKVLPRDKVMNKVAGAKQYQNEDEQILDNARELEGVMISQMVEPMFPKDDGSGIYGGGQGSDIYRMMMIQQYGQILSRSNGLGVAENIAKRLSKKGEEK